VLVLGGTHHVGRAAVEAASAGGDDVTIVNRGLSSVRLPDGVRVLRADRTRPGEIGRALAGAGPWDIVLDTWSGAPIVVRESAALLMGRADRYVYVSSRSVYQWPLSLGLNESGLTVDGDDGSADATDYAAAKRGAELAVLRTWGPQRSLIARAGLIVGPYELTGRLPWWLRRLHAGGRVLAPGPADRPLQLIDGRDLARWMLQSGSRGLAGSFNAVSRPGHATMGSLLEAGRTATGSEAQLCWLTPQEVESVGLKPWTELPIWLPPEGEMAGMHAGDVSAALAAGLTCRPIAETVTDTWRWILAEGYPAQREDRPPLGIPAARESEILSELRP
jgi:2'-hydroxyisoflavone reductase